MNIDFLKRNKDFMIVLAGRGLQAVIGFGIIRLVTLLLSTEEMGRYSILLSLTAFFTLFIIAPVGNLINRKTHEWHQNGILLKNLLLYGVFLVGVAAITYLVLLLVRTTIGVGVNITWYWLGFIVIGSLVFNTGNVTITTIFNMLGKRIQYVVFTLSTLLVGLGISFFFVYVIDARAEYWLAGINIGQLLIFCVAFYMLFRHLKPKNLASGFKLSSGLNKDAVRSNFHFTWPLSLVAGLGWVQLQSYRFVISNSAGLDQLGLFVIGFGIGNTVMTSFYEIFYLYYFPIFYKNISVNDTKARTAAWNNLASLLFPCSILVCSFAISCAPYLSKVLVSPAYANAVHYVIWGALVQFFYIIGNGLQLVGHSEMNTKWLIAPSVTGALVALCGVLLLSRWNIQVGTGLALVIAGAAMMVHLFISLHKRVSFTIPIKRIVIAILMSIPLLLVLLLYINPLFDKPNYIETLVILVVSGFYLLVTYYLMITRWRLSVEKEIK